MRRTPHPVIQVPLSAVPGIDWPAVPSSTDALVLGLIQQFEHSQWWPEDQLRRWQLRQAEQVLIQAYRAVPFYQGRLDAVGDRLGKGLQTDDFRRLPILTRTDVQTAGDALLARQLLKGHGSLTDVATSGSTGQPVRLKADTVTGLMFRAINLRYHLWHGRDFAQTTARIARMSSTADGGEPSHWGICHGPAPFLSFDVTRPVAEQAAWLAEQAAAYLLTYPSNLQALLEHSREAGFRPPGLVSVSTLGEQLDPTVRDLCRAVWGVPLIDAYSAQEVGMIALQCPEHPHYHVQSENLLLEVLDDDGRPCAPGETGRVVVTDLHNMATPLIRYEIGDHATVGPPCPCGRGLPVIERVLGRTRNMLTLPSGGRIWPVLNPVFETLSLPVRQFQLIQRTRPEIDVNLVVARPLAPAEEDELRAALRRSLNADFTFRLIYVDAIPRAATGKFEHVRSMVT